MNENLEYKQSPFNRFIIVGFVIGLILLGVGTIYLARVLEKRMETKGVSEHNNPFITGTDEINDDGVPEIPGVVVFHAENDVDQINMDADNREKQFRENISRKKNDPDSIKQHELLKKKNEFAAKRLEYLRKIEEAETREERDRLIQELKKFCEGKKIL